MEGAQDVCQVEKSWDMDSLHSEEVGSFQPAEVDSFQLGADNQLVEHHSLLAVDSPQEQVGHKVADHDHV
jgi:hypothetical protein